VLTSGYSHVLSENGSYGFELLQKPYTIEQLSRALYRVALEDEHGAETRRERALPAFDGQDKARVCPRLRGRANDRTGTFGVPCVTGHGQTEAKSKPPGKKSDARNLAPEKSRSGRKSRAENRRELNPRNLNSSTSPLRWRGGRTTAAGVVEPDPECLPKRPSRSARITC
jgi:hypothetical protein